MLDHEEYPDYEWEAEQDAKAGYIQPRELECTEREDNLHFGKAKSFVFLHIWLDDMRGWIPSQDDLRPAWEAHMNGTQEDFEVSMPDDSKVRVQGSKQQMEALTKAGEVLAIFSVGRSE